MTVLAASRRSRVPVPQRPTEGERPGFAEGVAATFRTVEDDLSHVQEKRRFDGYDELRAALVERGHDAKSFEYDDWYSRGVPNTDAIWQAVERERERDPKAFAAVPRTQQEYEQWVLNRRGAAQRDAATSGRAGLGARLVGGVGGAMTDPVNILTLPLGGGGKTVLQAAGREAVTGLIVEAVQTPILAQNRARRGEELSATEALLNLTFATVGGGVLGGLGKGVELGAPRAIEKVLETSWDVLPEAVRSRWAKGATISDADLPDLAEAIVGRGNMSVDERAAVDALRADVASMAASPFKRDVAGDLAHRVRLDEALGALLQPVERLRPERFAPVAGEAPAGGRAALLGGTTLGRGGAGTGARAQLKSRIVQVESGGNDAARNPLSSATGRYQFVDGTWLAYYKRRYGAQGLSDAAILAKRSDAALQETLMDDLLADNARFLHGAGEAESAGNLYLVHFAGQGGARAIFRAAEDAPVERVLGAEVVRANPFLRGMTAGDVIGWAHRKMREAPPRRAGARSILADGGDESAIRAQLQGEIDRIDAEADALRQRPARDDVVGEALDMPAARPDLGDDDGLVAVPVPRDMGELPAPRAAEDRADPVMVQQLLPQVTAMVDGGARLNNIEKLARELNALPNDVEGALAALVAKGRLVQRPARDGGGVRYIRPPRESGPVDMVKFIARNGGLRDDEGHNLGLVGLSAREEREMLDSVKRRVRDKRAMKGGRLKKFVPGAGPLLRHEGRSVDEMGELLWEAGYFPERPTTAEVLAALEDAVMNGKRILPADAITDDLVGNPFGDDILQDLTDEIGDWSLRRAMDLDDDEIAEMAMMLAGDDAILNVDDAFAALVNRRAMDALTDLFYEVEDEADYVDAIAAALGRDGAGEGGDGPARLAGNPRESDARAAFDAIEPEDFDAYAGRWDGADDPDAVAQTASLAHDLESDDLFGGATRDEARAALERRGDGAQDNGVTQKPVGSDGGLFDTAARGERDMLDIYLDADGQPRNWADVADELKLDETEINNLRDCI